MSQMKYSANDEMALMRELWDPQIADDPEAFAMFAYPWGKANTPLEKFKGPRGWQREVFQEVRNAIKHNRAALDNALDLSMFQEAVTSGRGTGKSACFAILTHWMQSTRIGSTVVVTANTEQQLKSRTWAELGKWVTMAINGHWFEMMALSMRPAKWFEEAVKRDLQIDTGYYYAQAQLWSEENPDAFAGIHNPHGIMVLYDEASGIPKPIWTVTEGFFTEPVVDRYWVVASNPRRPSGAFFECFHKDRAFWRCRHLDSRYVEGTDKAVYQKIIDKYGEDSDEARVEVKGQFPRQGDDQFISREVVEFAQQREVMPDRGAPLLMGVDVARFGRDKSIVSFRQGRDARSIRWREFKGLNTNQFSHRVAELIDEIDPDAVFIDGGGVGAGVVDNLKAWGYKVIEVQAGAAASEPERYLNKRAEIWDKMKEWLNTGAIPGTDELEDDLLAPTYHYHGPRELLALESKEDMAARGQASPDHADSLALTFAQRVNRKDRSTSRGGRGTKLAKDIDYDIFG